MANIIKKATIEGSTIIKMTLFGPSEIVNACTTQSAIKAFKHKTKFSIKRFFRKRETAVRDSLKKLTIYRLTSSKKFKND